MNEAGMSGGRTVKKGIYLHSGYQSRAPRSGRKVCEGQKEKADSEKGGSSGGRSDRGRAGVHKGKGEITLVCIEK